MNTKLIGSISRIFQKFESQTFDEYDVKVFLIDIREFLKEESFLREVADFVAHPERNKGICHQAADSRYARMKMINIGGKKLIDEKIFENNLNKPDRFFSDQVLNYIDIKKISKTDYLLFIQNSLEDIKEELLIENYKLTKKDIQGLLNKYYSKLNGYYILKPLPQKTFLFLEDLLKFLRGTITSQGVITQVHITRDIKSAIKNLNKLPGVFLNVNLIDEIIEPMIVCIIALLHDCTFIMYDGSEAKSFLSIHGQNLNTAINPPMFEYFTLTLMINTDYFRFPILTTNIRYENYVESTSSPEGLNLNPIPWIYTKRVGNKLLLVEDINT